METIRTRERSLVPGTLSSSSLDDSRLYKIYNEYEICNMQRDGPDGWAGFKSMFIDWKMLSSRRFGN